MAPQDQSSASQVWSPHSQSTAHAASPITAVGGMPLSHGFPLSPPFHPWERLCKPSAVGSLGVYLTRGTAGPLGKEHPLGEGRAKLVRGQPDASL